MILSLVATLAFTFSQAAPPMELARVELVGAKRFTPEHVTRLSGLIPGKPLTIEQLNAAAQRLANTGFFEEVKYRYSLAGRRATVVYELREFPWSVPVSFDNFVWFTHEEVVAAVQQDVPTFDGTLPRSPEMPDLMLRSLQKLLESRKVPGRVDFVPEVKLGSGEILQYVFAVKDPAPRLCGIRLPGATAISQEELADALRSGTGADYSAFSTRNVINGSLTHKYRRLGYWRASFAPPVAALAESPDCAGVTLTVTVTEGEPQAFGGTQWTGNAAVPSPQLEAAFGLKPGDVAGIEQIEAGLRNAEREYGRKGYLSMRSSYTPRFDDAAKRVTFDVQVIEGPQFRMGSFEVIGLPPADAQAITNQWQLKPGDPYDEEYARAFRSKEVNALGKARPGTKPPQMQTQVDSASRVVNIRIVAQ